MTISDQGWAAIKASEYANASSHEARKDAQRYAMKLMVEHLHEVHGLGPRKIGKLLGVKYTLIEKLLCPNS